VRLTFSTEIKRIGDEDMNTREIAAEYRMTHWAQIMQDRVASGQSIQAYCDETGTSRCAYFYWQKKLREATAQQLAAGPGKEKALVPSGWAQACVVEESVPEQAGGLTLRVGGAEIEVHQGFDETLLASVCRALSQSC
jgi:putative transposase